MLVGVSSLATENAAHQHVDEAQERHNLARVTRLNVLLAGQTHSAVNQTMTHQTRVDRWSVRQGQGTRTEICHKDRNMSQRQKHKTKTDIKC